MEQLLQTILEEIKEIKSEVQQEKIGLYGEMIEVELYERLTRLEKVQKEILLDIRKLQTEAKGHEYRISKIEDKQKLEKVG